MEKERKERNEYLRTLKRVIAFFQDESILLCVRWLLASHCRVAALASNAHKFDLESERKCRTEPKRERKERRKKHEREN